jgi:hypothetical protein
MGLPERLAVQRELNAELPQAGAALIEAVRAQIPTYQTLAPAQLAEVQAIAVWALGRAVALWVHDGALGQQDLARFRGIGAARAADGRPLPAVLRAYRITASVASDLVVERGRGRLDVSDVLALTRVWWASIDELSEALFTGYTLAAERLAGDRERALRDLFDDLLVGRQTSPGALADRCQQLGVTLPALPCLLVVEPVDPIRTITDAAIADVLAKLVPPDGDQLRQHLVASRGRRTALLLPPQARAGLAAAVSALGWRGCAIAEQPVTEAARAYRLAVDALDTAPGHAYHDHLLTDGDAHVLALLSARPTARPADVVRTVLGPLTEPRHAHLLDGLGAFLATGSATAAADLLGVHPQTLRYRLRRVRELTGRDPRQPWQRLVLDIARHLVELAAPARP